MPDDGELRIRMRGPRVGPGSHTIYMRPGGELVVDWYDHGEEVPYESANMIVLGIPEQAAAARALELPVGATAAALAHAIGERFESYFDFRRYLDLEGLAYRHEVDFSV